MKKILIAGFVLTAFVMSAFSLKTVSYALDGQSEDIAITLAEENLDFNCKSAYLVDFNSGTVIFEKNPDARYPIASMCKIMTLLLTFEAADEGIISLNDSVVVSEAASGMGGSQAFLEANQSYVISELVKSIVIASANDSSVAMAETIKGSESAFTERMNERAKQLGMENTLFANCTGLPKPSQYSSARDVSIMTRELLKHKEYYNYSTIWMDNITHSNGRVTGLTNTNKLVRFYNGCDAGKTGYTVEAKHCLSASALRDGTRLVATVIGAEDSKIRFAGISSMFNYGFANYKNVSLIDSQKVVSTLEVIKGKENNVNLFCENNFSVFAKKGEEKSYKIEYDIPQTLVAPVLERAVVGKAYIVKDNKVVGEVNIVAEKYIAKKTYFDNLKDMIEEWSL